MKAAEKIFVFGKNLKSDGTDKNVNRRIKIM